MYNMVDLSMLCLEDKLSLQALTFVNKWIENTHNDYEALSVVSRQLVMVSDVPNLTYRMENPYLDKMNELKRTWYHLTKVLSDTKILSMTPVEQWYPFSDLRLRTMYRIVEW